MSRLLESFCKLSLCVGSSMDSALELLYSDQSDMVYAHTQQVMLNYDSSPE